MCSDGPWIPREDEASIFTAIFYLNDDFEGGNTEFLASTTIPDSVESATRLDSEVRAVVRPRRGGYCHIHDAVGCRHM